ncbi:MAG: hypothetical protein N3E38_03175 [Candidatus Aenigmarchaeota archaeon]|nr:hypothetical protein [Candidatus Aenigmarchaeota archaeon]
MKLADHAYILKDFRKNKQDTVIIIPVHQEYKILQKHLMLLSNQTTKKFDAAIILNFFSDDKKIINICKNKKIDFGIVLIKRKSDSGSAGGFADGQLFALENGYRYIILADVDCFPKDRDLIEYLLKYRKVGYACSSIKMIDNKKEVSINKYGNPPFYCLFSRMIVETYGIYFREMYAGGEDLEYQERINSAPLIIKRYCTHPYPKPFEKPTKYLAYLINGIKITKNVSAILTYAVTILISIPIYLAFCPNEIKRISLIFLYLLIKNKYGKDAYDRLLVKLKTYSKKEDKNTIKMKITTAFHLTKNFLSQAIELITKTWRKKIIVQRTYSGVLLILIAISARRLDYMVGKNKYLLITDNTNPAFHLLKMLSLFPLGLATLLVILIFMFLKVFTQPNTHKYGLE